MGRSTVEKVWFHRIVALLGLLALTAATSLGVASAHDGEQVVGEAPLVAESDYVDLCGEIATSVATGQSLARLFRSVGLPISVPMLPASGDLYFKCASDNVAGEIAVVFLDTGSDAAVAAFTSKVILIEGNLADGFPQASGPVATRGFAPLAGETVSVDEYGRRMSR